MSTPEQNSNPSKPSTPEDLVTLRELLIEARDEALQWDRGFPGTVRWLVQQPTLVIRGLLWQRSQRFTRPLRFLLITVAIAVLMEWLIRDQLGWGSAASEQAKLDSFLLEHAAILQLLLLPLIAAFMRLCFFGLQLRYVDALVTMAYVQGMVNLLGALMLPLQADYPYANWLTGAAGLVLVGYALWVWASVAIGPAWRRWLASVLLLVLSSLLNAVFLKLLERWL